MALMVDVADSLPLMPRLLPGSRASAAPSTIRSTHGEVGRIMGRPSGRRIMRRPLAARAVRAAGRRGAGAPPAEARI